MKRIKILYMHDDGRDIPDTDAVLLDEGEFVARWETCPKCQDGIICLSYGGCDLEGEQVEPPVYEQCEFCNGTGRVAVPVEAGK